MGLTARIARVSIGLVRQGGLVAPDVAEEAIHLPQARPDEVANFKYLKADGGVWGLGATLYHMLTGQLPFDFPPGQERASVIARGRIVALRQRDASLPPRVAEVIDHSISARPKERYGTATEFRTAIEQAL